MSKEPRTPDDGRNERQRQEQDASRVREPDDGRTARQRIAEEQQQPDFLKRMEEERQRPDFIERTRPEDPSDHFGQLTRDNVNPDIPSAEPGKGDIVDPNTLGMDQSQQGTPPPTAPAQREQWPKTQEQQAAPSQQMTEQELAARNHLPSINEPFGSNITTGSGGPAELPPLVLSDISPDAMVVGIGTFPLTVTGEAFIQDCVVVFDDAEVPTTFVSQTELRADCPVSATAEVVDVEVHRGEDMSDVLSFEFTAVMREGREKRTPERKPKKDTPRSKRQKKGKR